MSKSLKSKCKEDFSELTKDHKEFFAELSEMLPKGYEDPVFFSEYFLGVPLHGGQKEFLIKSDPIANPESTRKNILVPCNRWGKTVALAIKHIRFCFYKIGIDPEMTMQAMRDLRYATLDLSPHSNQVQACYNFIFDILHNRFVTIVDGKKRTNKCKIRSFFQSKNDSKNRILFNNYTNFFGASTGEDHGASLAGRQFGLITYDECVFSHHLRTELPGRIMSRTIDYNAPIDLVSTFDAEAKSQQYYFRLVRQALKGQNEWWCKTGKYTDNIFIPEDIREAAKKKIMAEDYSKFRQVFLGEAVPSSIKVFEPEVIDNIFRDILRPQEPVHGRDYLISVDWGGSDQGDPTVMMVFDYTEKPYRIVHHERIQGGSPTLQFSMLKNLQIAYNNAKIIMDTNSLGGVLIKKLLSEMKVKTYDFTAHGGEKGEAVTQLKLALTFKRRYEISKDGLMVDHYKDYGKLRSYYIPELEEQLGSYEIKDEGLEQDFVATLYQALWFLGKKEKSRGPQTFFITKQKQQYGRVHEPAYQW